MPREAQRTSVKDASLVLLTRWEPGSLWWSRPGLVSVFSVELKSFARRQTEQVGNLVLFLNCPNLFFVTLRVSLVRS